MLDIAELADVVVCQVELAEGGALSYLAERLK